MRSQSWSACDLRRDSKYSEKQMTVTVQRILQPCFSGVILYPKLTSTGKLPYFEWENRMKFMNNPIRGHSDNGLFFFEILTYI